MVSHDDWLKLAALWNTLAAVPDNAARLMLKQYLFGMGELLQARSFFAVLAGRQEVDLSDPLHGFRVVDYFPHGADGNTEIAIVDDYAAVEENITMDPATVRLVTEETGPRAYRRNTLMRPEDPPDSPGRWLEQVLGIAERLVAAVPISENAELFVGFDRQVGEELFSDRDLALLRASLHGIERMATNVALGYGLLPGATLLSPREREIVAHLLDGWTEQRIADELEISKGTAHQYVVSAYRKLGVRSRGALAALWIHRGRRD